MMRRLNPPLLVALLVGLVGPFIVLFIYLGDRSPWSTETTIRSLDNQPDFYADEPAPADWARVDRILVFGGDLMRHVGQADQRMKAMLALLKPELAAADLAIANLEFPINPTKPAKPKLRTVQFNGRPEDISDLAGLGFRGLSLANNHAFDQGLIGLNQTVGLLSKAGIKPIGLKTGSPESPPRLSPARFDLAGLTVDVYGATFAVNVYKKPYPPALPAAVLPLNDWTEDYRAYGAGVLKTALTDLPGRPAGTRILFAHWGREWSLRPIGSQLRAAEDAFRAGFDLVIGSHSHVIGPVLRVGDRRVVTSLGNLVSDFRDRTTRVGALAYVGLSAQGRVTNLGLLPLVVFPRTKSGDPLHLVVPLNAKRKKELIETLNRAGAPDGETMWRFGRELANRVFGPFALSAPPDRKRLAGPGRQAALR